MARAGGFRMTVKFRMAGTDDAPTLSRLGAETFTETFGHLYDPGDLAAFLVNHDESTWRKELADEESIFIATDAPLNPAQLTRIATRAGLGLARTGSVGQHASGEIFAAFATTPRSVTAPVHPDSELDQLFAAAVEATEEAVISCLVAAETVTGVKVNGGKAMLTVEPAKGGASETLEALAHGRDEALKSAATHALHRIQGS